jgi:hypothetical protein
MNELLFAAPDFSQLRERLLGSDVEQCAVLLCNRIEPETGRRRFLVADVSFPGADDYARQGALEAQLRPDFVARVAKRALQTRHALVFVHTHPQQSAATFSDVDSAGEHHLAAFLTRRGLAGVHGALVIAGEGCCARLLGTDSPMRVIEIGEHRDIVSGEQDSEPTPATFDRQVRAFGAAGQRELAKLHVGIVGLGGTGSVVAQQLAHLGVGRFTFIDPDVVEESNLNRLANAGPQDIGQDKVAVATRYVQSVAPGTEVIALRDDVIRASVARRLNGVDLLLCCTDSHGSRAVVQQLAYQYLIPCIDLGTVISVRGGRVTHVFGRVQLLTPGAACLTCSSVLDGNQVRRDMMTAFERQADPYMQGATEAAPAVMSLNSVAASLAVGMVLALVTRAPFATGYLLYNATAGTVRRAHASAEQDCIICSKNGALARGDSWPLLARQD